MKPKVIVGLGNIGPRYIGTRHNIGFMSLDALADEHDAQWREKTRFKAYETEVTIGDQKVLLIKPTTFYNLSGEAVQAVKDFYKLENSDILVIHDELALPFGTVRTRGQGSDAGNNGIKSVSQHIGQDYPRVRIGIANELLERVGAVDFVLSKLQGSEQEKLPEVFAHIKKIAEDFASNGELEHHTHQL